MLLRLCRSGKGRIRRRGFLTSVRRHLPTFLPPITLAFALILRLGPRPGLIYPSTDHAIVRNPADWLPNDQSNERFLCTRRLRSRALHPHPPHSGARTIRQAPSHSLQQPQQSPSHALHPPHHVLEHLAHLRHTAIGGVSRAPE